MEDLTFTQQCEIAQTLFVENITGKMTEQELVDSAIAEYGITERKALNLIGKLYAKNIIIIAGKQDTYKLNNYLVRQAIQNMNV